MQTLDKNKLMLLLIMKTVENSSLREYLSKILNRAMQTSTEWMVEVILLNTLESSAIQDLLRKYLLSETSKMALSRTLPHLLSKNQWVLES